MRQLLLAWIAVHLTLLAPPVAAQRDASASSLAALVPPIEKNLRQNVIPFWFPRCVDREHGGYTIHHGPDGEPRPGGTKGIVTQARTLWLASRLLRSGHGQPGVREAADAGFRFLRDRMWDAKHGGFFWEVDPAGTKVLRADKHLYGQAFGLYALSEYQLATGSPEARSLADRLFSLLESRAHDAQFGGYLEFFARDWASPPPGAVGYLGAPADLKLMNTHLHLMEAMTTYVRAGAPLRARERLAELVAIESQAVIRRGWAASTDRHRRDWTPVLEATTRVSYGHDLENIWLLVDALRALDQPTAPYHDLFRAVFDYALRHGYDEAAGGFYDSGLPGKPADRRAKIWWVQAEALVSAVTMFELTGEQKYADVFVRTWEFVNTKQTDWVSGEWHEAIDPDGRPRAGNKAHIWKAGYHNGRALLEAVERIARVAGSADSRPIGPSVSYSRPTMPVLVSLLRGVNLARTRRIGMEDLRRLYESLKLRDVRTYGQSGNVVFRTDETTRLAGRIETGIECTFGFRSDVVLRTARELRDVVARNPFRGRRDVEPSKLLVTFLASEPGAKARAEVRRIQANPEELYLVGRELYIHFPLGVGRSKLPTTAIERAMGTPGTARNWNTVTKLLEIAECL